MIVLDTHVLIWWVSNPEQLSTNAAAVIEKEAKKQEIGVSAISVWEICMLVQKGRLVLTMDVQKWVEAVETLDAVQILPVNATIARASVFLPGRLHRDPADRMIIATARDQGVPLVTRDENIRRYRHVRTIW